MDNGNSASIIDLSAYRARRRERQVGAQSLPQQGASNSYAAGGVFLQFVWFWPTWVWVPVGLPTGSTAQWDAS